MDIEESKELLKKELVNTYSEKKAKAIKVVLNELDKNENDIDILLNRIDEYEKNTMWKYDVKEALDNKDKIIIAMAEQLTTPVHGIDWVIDYFTKKVTKED